METVKRCKNCDNSLYIGAPDDPDRRHHCDVITSSRIKTDLECLVRRK